MPSAIAALRPALLVPTALLAFVLWQLLPAYRAHAEAVVEVERATLEGLAGTMAVTLPDRLRPEDFLAQGSRVRYRIVVETPSSGDDQLAIYLPKVSLAGRVFLNGHELGSCAVGELKTLRCLHQPLFLVPAAEEWREGENQIAIEVFANDRQMNGLSRVYVGPARTLLEAYYLPRHLLQVELVSGLTWVSLTLAAMSLAVFFVLRGERVYLWFAVASIVNALSNINVLSTLSLGGVEFFSWLVFSARYASIALIWLTLCSAVKLDSRRLTQLWLALAVLAPVAIAAGGNGRWVTAAAYVPLGLLALLQTLRILRLAWVERHWLPAVIGLICVLILYASWLDWSRLGGRGRFEGVYVMVYTLTTVMLLVGGMLVTVLASALKRSERLALELDAKVLDRTRDLEAANRRLVSMSLTDSLTGLANRRHFDEVLMREWERWCRLRSRLVLITIDIDFFKQYNDHYGHPAGDDCLRRVSELLRQQIQRGSDFLARIGGEEFAVLETTGTAPAGVLAEKLRRAVEEARIPHEASPLGYVTISLGFTECGEVDCASAAELVSRTDQALYRAKETGRNRAEGVAM